MRIVFTTNKSGKHKWSKYDPVIPPFYQRHGYNWFFYLPRISWNKGYWKHVCTDWSIKWLCYSIGFIIWWKD